MFVLNLKPYVSIVSKRFIHKSQISKDYRKFRSFSILNNFTSIFRNYADLAQDITVKDSIVNVLCTKNNNSDCKTIIDMTYGDGHYTQAILDNLENVKIICLDRDKQAYEKAKQLEETDRRVIPVLGKFSDLPNILKKMGIYFNSIDGIVLDVGISESQTESRGFSPMCNALLDMRMDQAGLMAFEVLSAIEEIPLTKILKVYGEEKHSKKIARSIIETRYTLKKLEYTRDLNELVSVVLGTGERVDAATGKTEHASQRVYNGLRRFVNNELNELNYAMVLAEKYLKPGAALVTCCYSIVEDKIVKRHLTGNVAENCANELALKFVNHNLTVNAMDMCDLTYSPWNVLSKTITSEFKLRVAKKKPDAP